MVYLPDDETEIGARKISYCKKCLMPDSRPRIVFDDLGVCNACRYSEEKVLGIDWAAREEEFNKVLNNYRSKDNSWDCIVPWSGGKDSSAIAFKLKYEFDMNPLLVTFSPMMPTETGNHNREELIKAGFDHIFFRPNQKVHRYLAKRFFIERGHPKIAWDAGVNTIPVQVAVQYNIPLIFYAEHGETEYGGKVLNQESAKLRTFTEVIEHQIGDDPKNWIDEKVSEKDILPYLYPNSNDVDKVDIKAYYFGYFFRWSMFENYNFIKEKIDFKIHPNGRTSGTFTNFDSIDDKMDPLYYYMQYIKFGFGRTVRDASRFIQNGHMTYHEGLENAKKYDGEFPNEHLDEVLTYLDINEEQFNEIVEKHRNDEIWNKNDGDWKLNYPLPGN
ncbi:MAG: N-acetyl sugar amidotransferase [Desulfobacterales bacterium]|nr:N-acetyl sugar amidotransferase [Desulfobacterales bacterium]